jgi:molecular chaperone DnaK (HSP70)/uncharacterized protein YegL
MATYVGIDLGTTFSVVAYVNKEGRAEAIKNEYGRAITPSVVYLGPGGPIVGEEAKEKQAAGDADVASFFKRSMGDPNYQLVFQGKTYTPVDLSAFVLGKLKQTAETYLGQGISHAVVTVPAYFNNMQREATIRAGEKAGLRVLSIISEPTAAALAFGMRSTQGSQTVMVYDLGGGTFDVSIVQITKDEQRVLGTGGDHNLGGKDWDDRIFTYLSTRYEEDFGLELVGDDYNALLVQAEETKKSLSTRQSVEVRVQASGKTGTYTLTREQFENLTSDLMERTQLLTEQVLEDIHLSWADISQVLLVGGSTRMPMVKAFVERMAGKPPAQTINPDEAVALGAAIQATLEMESLNPQEPKLFLAGRKKSVDVMSHSLGMIAINDDSTKYINSIIIRKNQPIPSCETHPYTLRVNRRGDSRMEVFMTQGETDNPMDCAYLGKYVFSDIPPVSDQKAILDISYAYDKNGVVNVMAVERSTKRPLTLKIEPLPNDVPDRFALPPVMEVAREFLTVYLAFDLSGSMSGEPLDQAKKAAYAFLTQCDLSNASIGLISFSDSVCVETTASQNAKQISKAVDGLSIGKTGFGNDTHPFDAIFQALHKVSGRRYALVLADGVWNDQPLAISRAKRCHQEGIEIVGIGFGGADENFLRQISSSSENSVFTDMNQLSATFSTIAQELTEGSQSGKRGKLSFS